MKKLLIIGLILFSSISTFATINSNVVGNLKSYFIAYQEVCSSYRADNIQGAIRRYVNANNIQTSTVFQALFAAQEELAASDNVLRCIPKIDKITSVSGFAETALIYIDEIQNYFLLKENVSFQDKAFRTLERAIGIDRTKKSDLDIQNKLFILAILSGRLDCLVTKGLLKREQAIRILKSLSQLAVLLDEKFENEFKFSLEFSTASLVHSMKCLNESTSEWVEPISDLAGSLNDLNEALKK